MNAHHYEQYAIEIVSALLAITPQAVGSERNSTWTRRIKEEIGKIGKKHEFRVCTSGCDGEFQFEGEWLYDLIWYRNKNPNNRLETVPLVLESEWCMDDFQIRYDFEKLLLANSPLKVMVFQNYDETIDKVFRDLQAGIDDYSHGVPCTYILAGYQLNSKKFEIRTFYKTEDKNKNAERIFLPSVSATKQASAADATVSA